MSLLDGRHMSPSSSSILGAASAAPDADFRRSMILLLAPCRPLARGKNEIGRQNEHNFPPNVALLFSDLEMQPLSASKRGVCSPISPVPRLPLYSAGHTY